MDVSVIICCYNSASLIKNTLKHLALQELDGLIVEAILVDNCCKDDTVNVAQNSWIEFGSPYFLHIIDEYKPGLSNARKTGVLAAGSDVIVFCDDDNWLNPSYIKTAYSLLNSNHEIGMVGGVGFPVAEINIPDWLSKAPNRFACGPQAINSGLLTERNWLYGAGLCLKLSVIINLYNSGFKSFLIDRTGDELSSGGDVELCYWFVLVNKKLYYSSSLTFKHYLPAERLTKGYFDKLQIGIQKASIIHFKYECAIKFFRTRNFSEKLRWIFHLRFDFIFLNKLRLLRRDYFRNVNVFF
jgi:glycosyltransferase involved in cell wall biosynthesis